MSRTVLTLLVTLLAALPSRAGSCRPGRRTTGRRDALRLDRARADVHSHRRRAVPLADVRSFRLSDPPPAVPDGRDIWFACRPTKRWPARVPDAA
ncbi:MAG: hypothetical protein U0736_26555 [Gemmataceae bacterium]